MRLPTLIDAGRGLLAAAVLATALLPSHQEASADNRAAGRGERLAKQMCVACHRSSPPDVLPRDAWRQVIEKMATILAGKGIEGWGQQGPEVPLSAEYRAILEYYESKAPVALPALPTWPPVGDHPLRFVRRQIAWKDAVTLEPAVSNVRLVDRQRDGRLEAIVCDMRQGAVLSVPLYESGAGLRLMAQVPHPAHATPVDLDGTHPQDLLVADLGEFFPGDHERGTVTWLRARPDGGYAPFVIGGFPRVADVEAGDFDGDGRLDLLVAGFGWHRKGGIFLLLNRTTDWKDPKFERVTVDARPGPIHVIPVDLDRDGRLDFVTVIAQEHEAVVAFLGDGKGGFQAQTLYAAPHPNWGTTGIQLVDLDGDGDLDILATNGDMFDDGILKPYHGIQWLENLGGLTFKPHPLANLAGAHRAIAQDLDGDGDLDILASAFTGLAEDRGANLPSLVWLEQTRRGHFERHTIAAGMPSYATLDAGDIDGDGDIDIVAGVFKLRSKSESWLDVWENQRLSPRAR